MELVRFLLNCNVNIDATDQLGLSPLYFACLYRHHQIVDLLVHKGATVICDHTQLEKQLCQAGFDGDLELIKLFQRCEVNLNMGDYDKRTVGHLAACENRKELLLYLA